MTDKTVQLNKIQIKAEILTVISKLQSAPKNPNVGEITAILAVQEDKASMLEILMKEFVKANEQKAIVISFLMSTFCEKERVEEKLWDLLKNPNIADVTKSFALNLLKELGNKIDYDSLTDYFSNPDEVIDADTQKLLHTAIVNPEAQIDFMDFIKSLSDKDKEVLINSLGEDYSSDALANILNPLFLYSPESYIGNLAIEILGDTKSQLALHTLLEAKDFVKDEKTLSLIKKSISKLKLAGVRQDNAIDFYTDILSESRPYKSYISYPDGHGNQALMFSRERENGTIQFVAIVIADTVGIVDCFGFNDITKTEFERIIDRFYADDERIFINHNALRTLLNGAEKLTHSLGRQVPYEYICWKPLFLDVPSEPVPFDMILNMNFKSKKISEDDMQDIYNFDFVQRWFFDVDENINFKNVIDYLNAKIFENDFSIDFDSIVKDNLSKVFDKDEKEIFSERILMSAYLKYLAGEKDSALKLYSLYSDEEYKSQLYLNILRKSIYEYYVGKKFRESDVKKAENIFVKKNNPTMRVLNTEQIAKTIKIIESLWVNG